MAFRQDTSSGRGRWLCHFPAGLRRIRIRIPRRRLVTTSTTPHRTGRAEGCPGRTRRASAGSLSVKGERKRSLRGRSDRCRTPVRPPRAGARHSPSPPSGEAFPPLARTACERASDLLHRDGKRRRYPRLNLRESAALGPTPAARRPSPCTGQGAGQEHSYRAGQASGQRPVSESRDKALKACDLGEPAAGRIPAMVRHPTKPVSVFNFQETWAVFTVASRL